MSRQTLLPILLTSISLLLTDTPVLGQRDLRLEPIGKKWALVIGNNTYARAPLTNAANDARVMGQTLGTLGFQTDVLVDANAKAMEQGVTRFASHLSPGDVAVFYYAGHGVQVDGENYLIPVDFDGHDEADLKFRTQSASWVQEKLDKTGAQLKILILDACRTNPFRVSRDGGGGLAQMQGGRGSFIAFATAAGKVANDNVQDNNGLFTKHLVARLQQPGLTLDEVFNNVRADVDQASGSRQLPYIYSGVIGQFYFRPGTEIQPGTDYRITNVNSGMCLDTESHGILVQFPCYDGPNQHMRFKARKDGSYWIISGGTGCLEVDGGIDASGALIGRWNCGDTDYSGFRTRPGNNGSAFLTIKQSNKCLSVLNADQHRFIPVVQSECLSGDQAAHQMFRIEPWTSMKKP